MNDNLLSKRLKILRTEKGLTQEEFGKPYNLKKSTVSQYESGSSKPDDELKKRIAKDYGVSLDWLMGVSNIRNPYEDSIINETQDVYSTSLTKKDEKDISKDVEKIMSKLDKGEAGPTYFNGEEMNEEDKELFKSALELALKTIKVKNKETYTPKKYKKQK